MRLREDRADVIRTPRHVHHTQVCTISLTDIVKGSTLSCIGLRGLLLDAKKYVDFIHKAQGTAVAWNFLDALFLSALFLKHFHLA